MMPSPLLDKNDKLAKWLIVLFSVFAFLLVAALPKLHIKVNLPFNPHVFALINAVVNTMVTICLVWAYILVRKKDYEGHKRVMLTAIGLSVLFLISYVAHHILAGETRFGGSGAIRVVYLTLLATHIVLAAAILPFILFTAYRSLTGDYVKHKKIARYTFPIWMYVSVTGVIIYMMISPYYS